MQFLVYGIALFAAPLTELPFEGVVGLNDIEIAIYDGHVERYLIE